MAISVLHKFVSPKGDGTDATLIRPSNWNDTHKLEMAANNIIGRLTTGTGAAEEIPATSYMLGLLNKANYAALAAALGLPTTGDARLTFKSTPDAGWIMANDGTIGNTGSGASYFGTDTQALFTLFYNNFSDAVCPVQTSAGGATTRVAQGTASVAFTNNCRMVVPKQLGRALLIGGAGAGLTNRVLGSTGGEEAHVLTVAELASHGHPFSSGTMTSGTMSGGASCGSGTFSGGTGATNTGSTYTDHTHDFGVSGGVQATGAWTHDHGVATGVYGGTTVAGVQGGGTYIAPVGSGAGVMGIDVTNTDLNHSHGFSYNGSTGGARPEYPNAANHSHSINVSVSGSITVNSITVGINAGSVVTGTVDSVGSNTGHNNMQPWTAWNIMIRL